MSDQHKPESLPLPFWSSSPEAKEETTTTGDGEATTALEDAMSMQAQAERERQARVILGDSERQVAEKFAEAAKSYDHNPVAFRFEGHEHAL
jgi:hypothetical protein